MKDLFAFSAFYSFSYFISSINLSAFIHFYHFSFECLSTCYLWFVSFPLLILVSADAPVCLAENGVTVGVTKGENVGLRCATISNPTAFRFEWEFHGSGDNIDVVPIGKTISHGDLSRFFYTPVDSSFGTFLCWGSKYSILQS